MAGHWIKWEKGLVRKPEVMAIARSLKITPLHAAAACMLVWEWAEDTTEDGIIKDIELADVSFAAGVPGIAESMEVAGWINDHSDGISFPNWDRHNSEPAKTRALDALRKRAAKVEDKKKKLTGRMAG